MKTIYLADLHDAAKVAAALQQAADEVLNPVVLARLAQDKYNHRAYQYVHPDSASPAVASASILVGGGGEQRDTTALFISIKQPGGATTRVMSAPTSPWRSSIGCGCGCRVWRRGSRTYSNSTG